MFQKPDPFHGFVHEQYIIPSDNQIPRKFEDMKKPAEGKQQMKIKSNKK